MEKFVKSARRILELSPLMSHSVTEDRQTVLSILLELTVAASNLFDPKSSISDFLERIAERLGCAAVLFFEVTQTEKAEIKLIDSVGLARISREIPLGKLALDPFLVLPYPEL